MEKSELSEISEKEKCGLAKKEESYEVSRSLAACEGALLLVDAAQGVEAQTVSNAYLAIDNDLAIIPIINKVDLPSAMVEDVKQHIIELIGCEEDEIIEASAKSGVLKGTNGFNFGSLFEASLTLWRHPESFMEFPDRKECHLLRLSIPDLILGLILDLPECAEQCSRYSLSLVSTCLAFFQIVQK